MDGQSRIKFNPATKEIEIEGTEKFVKAYFDKLQAMLSGRQGAVAKAPAKARPAKAIKEKPAKGKTAKEAAAKKERPGKRTNKVAGEGVTVGKVKRGDMSKAVLSLIRDSPEGITTTALEEKTGLKDKQIWAIVSHAKKAGKIRQEKRGEYFGF